MIEKHDDGWYVQNYDSDHVPRVTPESSRPFGATFGPYGEEKQAEFMVAMARAILPTQESLKMLNLPGEFQRRMVQLMPRGKRKEIERYLRDHKQQG